LFLFLLQNHAVSLLSITPPSDGQGGFEIIKDVLVKREWRENREVTGAITLIYNHHQRGLVSRLMDIQHDCHHNIFSTQHIHLDHDHCLEIIIAKGNSQEIEVLYDRLKSTKGFRHAGFAMAAMGDSTV
jgi:CopG family nickel-responsive transcriptional regulator